MTQLLQRTALLTLLTLAHASAPAALTAEEIQRLGRELTPLGAERVGNAAGTIPAWDGGIIKAPEGFKGGGHHPDPFAADRPLYTVTRANRAQHAEKLSAGHQAMLEQYGDSFRMNVYPTRRSAAFPQYYYDATRKIAASAQLIEGGNGVSGAAVGLPFPIPKNGLEAIWNHILRYRALMATRHMGQAPVMRDGSFTMVKLQDDFFARYHAPDATEDGLDNVIIMFLQRILAPARLAGEVLLVHETLNQAKEHRRAWIYNPGQRRVQRAPNVAFDNTGTGSDGLRTSDQFDMFNGSPERYDWTLVGRKELIVPYNAYRLHSGEAKYTDIIKPLHLNPELARYELHRVWVVEANLKPGTRHLYKRRTFYLDEDSWQVLHVDQYDNRDQLWRVSEGHVINYYEVPTLWTALEVHYDLQSGRYLALGLNNEEPFTFDFSVKLAPEHFSTNALRQEGRR